MFSCPYGKSFSSNRISCFSLPIASCHFSWHHCLLILYYPPPPPPQVFIHRDKFPLCPPGLSRLKQLQLSAFSHVTGAFSPLIIFMATHFSMSAPVLYWEDTRIGHSAPDVILVLSRREESLPSMRWQCSVWGPGGCGPPSLWGHIGELCSTCWPLGALGPFRWGCFSSDWPQAYAGAWGLFLPKCRTWHFPLSFMRFWFACFSSLSLSTWMAAYPSGASATPPTFVSSADLAEGTLCLMVQVISEEIKQSWPRYRPLGHAARGWPPAGPLAVGHNPFSLGSSASFHSSSLSIYLACTSSVCFWEAVSKAALKWR